MSCNFEVLRGAYNVFVDFGDTDADSTRLKAQLTAEIIGTRIRQGRRDHGRA